MQLTSVGDLSQNMEYKCRICIDLGDADAKMCAPCECIGSVKYIHVTCLKEWIKEKRSVKCELCGSNYKKKWVNWAVANGVIKKDNTKEELRLKQRNSFFNFLISIICIISLFVLVLMYTGRNTPLDSPDKITTACFYILAVNLLIVYSIFQLKFYGQKDFKTRIENYLMDLFPHSSNENYARSNLPVVNSVRT